MGLRHPVHVSHTTGYTYTHTHTVYKYIRAPYKSIHITVIRPDAYMPACSLSTYQIYPSAGQLTTYICTLPYKYIRAPTKYIRVPSEYIRVPSENIRVPSEYVRVPSEYVHVHSEYIRVVVCTHNVTIHTCTSIIRKINQNTTPDLC